MDSSSAIDSNPVVQQLQRIQGEVYRLVRHRVEHQPLPTLVRKMLLLFNGERPLDKVCERCDVSLGKGRAVVRKLVQLGVLERTAGAPPDAEEERKGQQAPSGFTWDEEAFFASELPPVDECDLPFETVGSKVKKALRKIKPR